MLRTMKTNLVVAIAVAGLFLVGLAFAHETRIVDKYKFVVGFRLEPNTFVNEPNAADIIISRNVDGRPINRNAGDTVDLQIEVQLRDAQAFDSAILKSAILTFPLEQVFQTTNRYNSWFKPTRVGTYAFHITGTVDDTAAPSSDPNKAGPQMIDQTFVCESPLPPATHGFECISAPQGFPDHRAP